MSMGTPICSAQFLESKYSLATTTATRPISGRLFGSSSGHSKPTRTIFSAASTGYTATSMSYDQDTSVAKRRQSPKLYGYIPDQGRALVFFLMFMLSVLQLFAKVSSTALLLMTNPLQTRCLMKTNLTFLLRTLHLQIL